MSFGRWLLVHSFSISLLALLLMLYQFRTELQLDQAYRQLLNLEPAPVVSKQAEKSLPESKTQTSSPVHTSIVTSTEKPTPTTTQTRPDAFQQNLRSSGSVSTDTTGSLVAVPTINSASSLQQKINADLLSAREDYWNRDYAHAIDKYLHLIQQYPENPDYPGELGNIYYTLNDNRRAANLYYRAASLLLKQNKLQHAASLLAPITALDRELADRLQQQLKHHEASSSAR